MGNGSYLGSTSKERMVFSEQMLPLSKARKINRSHSSPLRQGKDSLGVALLSFWGAVGAASYSEGDAFGMGRVFCGKKDEGSLESKPIVSFLDGLKAKEQSCL